MKLLLLIVYFAVLIGIGLYCRKHATDVNGFSLPMGRHIFQQWYLWDMPDNSAGNLG